MIGVRYEMLSNFSSSGANEGEGLCLRGGSRRSRQRSAERFKLVHCQLFSAKDRENQLKLSFGGVLIIILVLLMGVTLSFFYVLLTPRWSFTIATNKAVYSIGEDIQITVSLKNIGYLHQSITTAFTSPIIVWIEEGGAQAWYAPSNVQTNQTTFTTVPDQSLTRTFVWNGSWQNQERHSGIYSVKAAIPSASAFAMSDVDTEHGRQFYAHIVINITAV